MFAPRVSSIAALWVAGVVALSAQGWPRDVGVPEQEFQNSVYSSVTGGYLSLPMSYDQIRTLPLTRRVEVTMATATGAKAYLKSETFRARYAKDMAGGRFSPQAPTPARKYADHVKEEQASLNEQLAELKKGMASLPPDARTQMQAMAQGAEKMLQDQLRELNAASAEEKAAWEKEDRERFTQEEAEYAELVKDGKALPRDPNALVRRRLQEFLTQTADVDFNAKVDGQHRFVNPAYEAKPKIWKSCYRAGRLATDAARLYVQQWLKDSPAPAPAPLRASFRAGSRPAARR